MEKVIKLLWGNGNPKDSMVVRVQQNEDGLDGVLKSVERIEKAVSKAFWVVMIALLDMVLTIAANLILQHFH